MAEYTIQDGEAADAFAALDAALATVAKLDTARLTRLDRINVLTALEVTARTIPAIGHEILNTIGRLGDARSFGEPSTRALVANALRINETEASHRIAVAAELGERIAMSGEPMPPTLPETAAAQRDGLIGEPHVKIIRAFMHDLPDHVDAEVRAQAEEQLADAATQLRPDQLTEVAKTLAGYLNPDGKFSDQDRQRKRGFTLSKAGLDHMADGKLVATPALQALLDLVLAKYGCPGALLAEGALDTRTAAQRNHDALEFALGKSMDPKASHRGMPATVIVTAKLSELQKAASTVAAGGVPTGFGTTAGGRLMPMADLIRLASNSINYLAIFHDADERPLYLGRTQRLASADQRLVAFARDKGCTHPGCNAARYWVELHHIIEWLDGGFTDVDLLTCVCEAHHRLVTEDGWQTFLRNGRTVWKPPKGSIRKGGVNTYFRPDDLLDKA